MFLILRRWTDRLKLFLKTYVFPYTIKQNKYTLVKTFFFFLKNEKFQIVQISIVKKGIFFFHIIMMRSKFTAKNVHLLIMIKLYKNYSIKQIIDYICMFKWEDLLVLT